MAEQQRYMVGVRCPLKGCTFEEISEPTFARAAGSADPDVEKIRAHLMTHPLAELAEYAMTSTPSTATTRPWKTTYRLVAEERPT